MKAWLLPINSTKFDLQHNELITTTAPNPNAGREHRFIAYRLKGDPGDGVTLRSRDRIIGDLERAADEDN